MSDLPNKSDLLIYKSESGAIKLEVRFDHETVWLTQQQLAELFQTTVPNISMHLRNVFAEGELRPEATLQSFLTVRQEGPRQVSRELEHYNLTLEYDTFHRERLAEKAAQPDDFDQVMRALPKAKTPGKKKRETR